MLFRSASTHIHVSKAVKAGRTMASAVTLSGESRVQEIARMLSGGAEKAALAHAEELLAKSRPTKKGSVRS